MPSSVERARTTLVGGRQAALAWAALAVFICYGSIGAFGSGQRAAALPGVSLPDIAQNVLLYIPFGVFGVWTLQRRTSARLRLYAWVVTVAAVYSIAMELLQAASAFRIASPADVIANVVGASVGAISSPATDRALHSLRERVRPTGLLTAPARYLLAAVLAAIVLAAWYPFDVTLDVSTLSDRTRAVRLDPWLWPGAAELSSQGARFFVLAAMLTACLPGLARRAAPVAAIACSATALIIDLGQIGMGSHPVGGAVWLSQAAGAGAGALFKWRDH